MAVGAHRRGSMCPLWQASPSLPDDLRSVRIGPQTQAPSASRVEAVEAGRCGPSTGTRGARSHERRKATAVGRRHAIPPRRAVGLARRSTAQA